MTPEPEQDPELDKAIGDYLAGELDGQLGCSQARFLDEWSAPIQLKPVAPALAGKRWLGWASLAGVAAALVWGLILWHVASLHSSQRQANIMHPPATQQEAQALAYTQTIEYRTVDQGTIVLDNQIPVRQLCRQTLERDQWIDPVKHQPVEVEIPSQEIVYVPLSTY
jgi:hypothetical protein